MLGLRKVIRCNRAQALVELTLMLPMLLALGLGVAEVGNMINSYLVMTHLTREAANLASRTPGIKGLSQWATDIDNGLNAVITAASPVISTTGTPGPTQWKVYYSMIEWDPAGGPCGAPLAGGQPDNYRIRRSNTGWSAALTWEFGSLTSSSQIGADGDCASNTLPEIKNLSTSGIVLHVVEVFYDYAPSKLTPAQNFIGALVPSIFYRRSVFMDVVG
jgi:Flp pilus assembly protein TadG